MRIEKSFAIPAAPAAVYELLVDLERVGACIPGGEVGPAREDNSHPAKIAVKLGPMRMTYSGSVRLRDADEQARCAVLATDLREQRGQGSARAEMTMAVAENGDGSLVDTVTEVVLSGRAAQMARGVIDEVADRLVEEMAGCLAKRLDGGDLGPEASASPSVGCDSAGAPKPINGVRLVLQVFWRRIKRAFGAK